MSRILIGAVTFLSLLPTTVNAGNITIPSKTGELLEACQIAVNNNFRSYDDAYKAAYCSGMLKGYIRGRFNGSTYIPGYDLNGFVKIARRIHNERRKNQWWTDASAESLIAAALADKNSGAVQCKDNPEQLCMAQGRFALFYSK